MKQEKEKQAKINVLLFVSTSHSLEWCILSHSQSRPILVPSYSFKLQSRCFSDALKIVFLPSIKQIISNTFRLSSIFVAWMYYDVRMALEQ